MYLEVSLRMSAYGADSRCFLAYHDMSAVAALPYLHGGLFEYLLCLHIVEQCTIALLVVLLHLCYHAEAGCQLGESFLFRGLCKACVHIRPLVVLAFGCLQQAVCGISNAVVQFLVPQFGMLFLVVSRFQEEGSNLLKSFFLRLACKISVLVACLRFACECNLQIFLGLGTGLLVCHSLCLFS